MAEMVAVRNDVAPVTARTTVRARRSGFVSDLVSVAGRGVRAIPRDTEAVIPALSIPVFFFLVNTGSMEPFTERFLSGFDYKAFQVPVAIVFGVTGVSRATTLVLDIQNGYFDRMLLSPVNRLALLLGLMVADLALAAALTVPVIVLGLFTGVSFASGVLGILAIIALSALWSLVYAGFPYAIALKTGNPAAVNMSFLLFFPFVFLTSTFLPREALSGWLDTVATWNPLTYLLEGLRSLISVGWDAGDLGQALLAVVVVAIVSWSLAFRALASRVRRT